MSALPPALPWQMFFTQQALTEAQGFVETNKVGGLDTHDTMVNGIVFAPRRSYHPGIMFIGPIVGSDRVLKVTELMSECECAEAREGCSHSAAIIMGFCELQEFREPPPQELRQLRDSLPPEAAIPWVEPRSTAEQDAEVDSARSRGSFPLTPKGPPGAALDPAMPALARRYMRSDHPAMHVEHWLNQNFAKPELDPDRMLTFHLIAPDADARAGSHWGLELVLAKRLKSGLLGVRKRYNHISEAIGRIELQSPGDQQIVYQLAALVNAAGGGWQSQVQLDARDGASGDLLERIIASGRAFAEDFSHPLALGPVRALRPVWAEQEGAWRMTFQAEDGSTPRLIPVQPPWYITDGQCGPISVPVPEAHLPGLAVMPPVPDALIATVAARLRRLMPNLPEPPLATRLAVLPQGRLLRVHARLAWSVPPVAPVAGARPVERQEQVEVLCVLFRYGSLLCAPGGSAPLMDDAGEPVLRDTLTELALVNQLTQLGLMPLGELSGPLGLRVAGRLPGPAPCWVARATLVQAASGADYRVAPMLLAALVASGWEVTGEGPAIPAISAAAIEARFDEPEEGGTRDWFQLALGVRFGTQRVDLGPVLMRLLEYGDAALAGLPRVVVDGAHWICLGLPDGTVVRVPEELLTRLVSHLLALYDRPPGVEGWRTDPWQALTLQGLLGLEVQSTARLDDLVAKIKNLRAPGEAPLPPGFTGELRAYQRAGLAWMTLLRAAGAGGILADDMGLGKTVQAIAHICAEQAAGRLVGPVLVVGPASMVGTWRRELERFAAHLTVLVQHGAARTRDPATLKAAQVVITTYATLLRDADLAGKVLWSLIIADEAQFIANPSVKSGQALRGLRTSGRLAMTGTPLSNHLGELHTLMHWVMPGVLGSAARFETSFRTPIESRGDAARAELLRQRIAPFLLRRTKEAVAPDLPPRSESQITVTLEGAQRALYESVRLAMDQRIRAVVATKGLARSRIEVFEALTTLRICCCDPRLVKLPSVAASRAAAAAAGAPPAAVSSAKLEWLRENLPQLIEDGRRILLFSQFTSWLDLVESDVLTPLEMTWLRLDGSTRDRETPVRRFQSGGAPLFLLSLKAGGTGLTLTAADTVIIADPWWNPAAEDQAADRAHRIGQDKPVFIYRLVTQDTVEERILVLQERKRELMASMLDASGQALPGLSDADLDALLAPLPD